MSFTRVQGKCQCAPLSVAKGKQPVWISGSRYHCASTKLPKHMCLQTQREWDPWEVVPRTVEVWFALSFLLLKGSQSSVSDVLQAWEAWLHTRVRAGFLVSSPELTHVSLNPSALDGVASCWALSSWLQAAAAPLDSPPTFRLLFHGHFSLLACLLFSGLYHWPALRSTEGEVRTDSDGCCRKQRLTGDDGPVSTAAGTAHASRPPCDPAPRPAAVLNVGQVRPPGPQLAPGSHFLGNHWHFSSFSFMRAAYVFAICFQILFSF